MDREDVVHILNGILSSHSKEWNLAICENMDGPWGHYAKWNKSDRERQMPYDLVFMWKLKNKTNIQRTNQPKLIDTENRLVVARGGCGGWAKMDEVHQKMQTSSYKVNKSWGYNVQHGDYT